MGTLVSNADAYVVTAGERYPTSWVTIPHVDKCQVYLGGEQDVAVRCMEILCKSITERDSDHTQECVSGTRILCDSIWFCTIPLLTRGIGGVLLFCAT